MWIQKEPSADGLSTPARNEIEMRRCQEDKVTTTHLVMSNYCFKI